MSDRLIGMKGGIAVIITTFLIICIFMFDVKVSAIIQKIPLLSSIIDTKILEDFEAINERDEFYKAMMNTPVASSLSNGSMDTSKKEEEAIVVPSSEITPALSVNIPIPKAIQNLLPPGAKIGDMTVRNVSPTERLFKITLDSGVIRYIQVRKE